MKQKPDILPATTPVSLLGFSKVRFFLSAFLLATLFMFSGNDEFSKSAAKAYEKEDYKSSISEYEKIVASGEVSSALYYNLGNAYYKNNQLGKAIYNYERAHKLNPADEDVKHNLTLANKRKKDLVEQKENYFAKNIESGILNLFTTTGWAWVTILSLAIAFVFFAGFKLSLSGGIKRLLFWSGTFSAIICIIAFITGFLALHSINKQTQAIVLSDEIQVFNSPTTNAKSQFTLHEGTKVNILVTNNDWTSIVLENGNEGWVLTKDIGVF